MQAGWKSRVRQRVGNRPVKNLRMEREDSGQGGKDIAVNEPWEKMTQDNPWSRVLSKGKDDQIALVVVGQICSRHLLPEGEKKKKKVSRRITMFLSRGLMLVLFVGFVLKSKLPR